jgi:hypothetical protein
MGIAEVRKGLEVCPVLGHPLERAPDAQDKNRSANRDTAVPVYLGRRTNSTTAMMKMRPTVKRLGR